MPRRALAALPLSAALLAAAPTAHAQGCTPPSVPAGGAVPCTGTDADGFDDGSDDITVEVEAGAVVRSPDRDAVRTTGDDVTVTNDGTIEALEPFAEGASGDEGVQAGDRLTLVNRGTIAGGKTGVAAGDALDLLNEGAITSANEGVEADDDAVVENAGLISGADKGIDAGDGLLLLNEGTISSANEGVEAGDFAIVSNLGTISGDDDGLNVGEFAFVSNEGEITSADGDAIDADSLFLLNEGLIESASPFGAGVDFDASTTPGDLDPFAAADAPGDEGLPDEGDPSSLLASIVDNLGTIRGGTGILVETGEGGDPPNLSSQVVLNSGLIEGTGGTAVNLGAGNDAFGLFGDGRVIGDVRLGEGDDLLGFVDFTGPLDASVLFDGGEGFDIVDFVGVPIGRVGILSRTGAALTLSVDRAGLFSPPPAGPVLAGFDAMLADAYTVSLAGFERFLFDDRPYVLGAAGFEAAAPIPLPAAGWMLLAGLGGLGALRARRR